MNLNLVVCGVASTVALSVAASNSAMAQAAVQWRVEDGGNGHWYALVITGPITWDTSQQASLAVGGYLATPTSPDENAFVAALASDPVAWYVSGPFWVGPWLGGYQPVDAAEPAGNWTWVTGELWGWSNWHVGEPNDGCGGGEDVLCFLTQPPSSGPSGWWNDQGGAVDSCSGGPTVNRSYVVEWSADCNGDGIVDYGQIRNGELTDANGNGIPDVCESPNLVANGGFEAADFGGCPRACYTSCGFGLDSWTRGPSSISVDLVRNDISGCGPHLDTGGVYRIELQGSVCCGCNNNGWIQQPIALSAGASYRFEMDVLFDDYDVLSVSCGGASHAFSPQRGIPAYQWAHVAWDFTCVDPNAPLRIESIGANDPPDCLGASYANLDNVRVVKTGVPECVTRVPADYSTIQQAINAAPTSGHCLILVDAGTHAGPVDFGGKDIVVRGVGAEKTVINGTGGQTVSVVQFSGGEPATAALEQVTVRGGTSGTPLPGSPQFLVGGGVLSYNSAASIHDCIVENNVSGFGGGTYFWHSTGTITNCVVRNNSAAADGGGIQLYGGSPIVTDTVVENNTANSRGAGMHIVEGNPRLVSTTVQGNSSANVVGGVSWAPVGVATAFLQLESCSITGNTAGVVQGGLGVLNDGPVSKASLAGTTVCSNTPRPNVSGLWTDLGGNTICVCMGDLNLNDAVDGADLGILLAAWGAVTRPTAADINHDGIVDGADLGALLGAWGPCGP
jgi:hypothetical protein